MLTTALQEWAACCAALCDGRQILIVRKGGIHERHGGLFSLEHDRFLLLPTYLHQDPGRLQPDVIVPIDPHPGFLHLPAWAEATHIWKCDDLARVQALDDELLWTADELASRFRYRDQPWLYVVALRVHRLPVVAIHPDLPRYAGCRSWITLETPVYTDHSTTVLDDAAYAQRVERIAGILAGG
jgi:hypothetical protein